MARDVYLDNVLRERWDDALRTATFFNAAGAQTSSRAYTPNEVANATALSLQQAATGNKATIFTQAGNALVANRTFLAIASPTNAQTLAQVQALTRQVNGIMRLELNQLDGTD